jgi:hypothetical protein
VKLRRELLVALAILLVGWLGLMAGLSKWQRGRAGRNAAAEAQLPHYPGTESLPEQTSPNLGLHKYWFKLNEEYPSLAVFYFYQNELEPDGWRLAGDAQPKWVRQKDKDQWRDIFRATWLDPKHLFQIDLEMMSTAKVVSHQVGTETEEREPGIEVYATLRRTMLPAFITREEAPVPSRPGIETGNPR